MTQTIAQIIYDIEEMENTIIDNPEEYSYDEHMLPLKLKLAQSTIALYYRFEGLGVDETAELLWNEFGFGEK